MVCLSSNHIPSNFLKAVFHKIYLVHSWMRCLIQPGELCNNSSLTIVANPALSDSCIGVLVVFLWNSLIFVIMYRWLKFVMRLSTEECKKLCFIRYKITHPIWKTYGIEAAIQRCPIKWLLWKVLQLYNLCPYLTLVQHLAHSR